MLLGHLAPGGWLVAAVGPPLWCPWGWQWLSRLAARSPCSSERQGEGQSEDPEPEWLHPGCREAKSPPED